MWDMKSLCHTLRICSSGNVIHKKQFWCKHPPFRFMSLQSVEIWILTTLQKYLFLRFWMLQNNRIFIAAIYSLLLTHYYASFEVSQQSLACHDAEGHHFCLYYCPIKLQLCPDKSSGSESLSWTNTGQLSIYCCRLSWMSPVIKNCLSCSPDIRLSQVRCPPLMTAGTRFSSSHVYWFYLVFESP